LLFMTLVCVVLAGVPMPAKEAREVALESELPEDWDAAAVAYQDYVKSTPDDVEAGWEFVEALFLAGYADNGAVELRRLSELDVPDSDVVSRCHYLYAITLSEKIAARKASVADFVEAADVVLADPRSAELHAELGFKLAWTLYEQGSRSEAKRRLMGVLELQPDDGIKAQAFELLCRVYVDGKKWVPAEKLARKLLSEPVPGSDEDYYAAVLEQAAFQVALQGDAGPSAAALETYLAEFPESEHVENALFQAAEKWQLAGDPKRAGGLFERFVHEYPESERVPEAFRRRGESLAATEHHEEAAVWLESFSSRHPEHQAAEPLFWQAAASWQPLGKKYIKQFTKRYLARFGEDGPHAAELAALQ
jgi:tetratricopeptide (TPR) repeat protein